MATAHHAARAPGRAATAAGAYSLAKPMPPRVLRRGPLCAGFMAKLRAHACLAAPPRGATATRASSSTAARGRASLASVR
eukprot:8290413-Alexandrium_andersonii.AAC.1